MALVPYPLARTLLFGLDPEDAHDLTLAALARIQHSPLLCTVSLDSTATGVNFDTAAAKGVLSKAPDQVWSGVNSNTGTPTWYRHVTSADDGTESTTAYRIQGTVGVAGEDLNLSSNTLTAGATQTIDYYSIAWPTL